MSVLSGGCTEIRQTSCLDRTVLGCRTFRAWTQPNACNRSLKDASVMKRSMMMMINDVTTLNTCSLTVDKSKPKTSSRPQQPQQQQQTPRPNQSTGPPDVVPVSVSEGAARDQSTEKLRGLLAACDRRFQAIAIVLQQTLSEVRTFFLCEVP